MRKKISKKKIIKSDFIEKRISMPLTSSRRFFRITLNRNDTNNVTANLLMSEGYRDKTGDQIINSTFLINLEDSQVKTIPAFSNYISGIFDLGNNMKLEWDASGSCATGSIQKL